MKNKYQRNNIGEQHEMLDGSMARIIDGGTKSGCCTILYNNGESKKEVFINSLRDGRVKNEYTPSVYGVGYTGIGQYILRKNGDKTKTYKTWKNMLSRCYDNRYQEKHPTYIGVTVFEEWHNFQVFAKWFNENYREFEGSRTELDKDLLGDGTIYSPKTCCFIPARLNSFLTNINSNNTSGFIGVIQSPTKEKFIARIRNIKTNSQIHLGTFNSAEKAGMAYNLAREKQCNIMREICINRWDITDKRILDNIK